nr:pentapeptide repeat-containing protein [Scytonema sp. UIC 10036]
MTDAFIQSGDWSNTDLHRSDWTDAVIENVCLKIARFQGARLHRATITNCNFQTANLVAATAHDTVFNHCDFRNANLEEFTIKNTRFYKCGFYNCKGIPKIEGKCEFIEPDVSEEFDGSKIVNQDKILTLWNKASLSI